MKKKNYSILLILLCGHIFLGCGNSKLSENEAREIISKKYPEDVSGTIELMYTADYFTVNRTGVMNKQAYLQEAGLIFQNKGSGRFMDAYRAGFTDKAKSFMIGEPESLGAYSDKVRAYFKIGQMQFAEISGIFQEGTPGVAEVGYSVKFVSNGFPVKCSTKEFGDLAGGETINLKIKLKKFDDGWRISD
ncbi:MAG: hypothetical protein HUU43_17170 [Ignavibacteriaceae bacterium]|nr:hypothetical protein [Ignavibacteriaceae bacterium]